MKVCIFFETLQLSTTGQYNARSSIRNYLKWKHPKTTRNLNEVDNLDILKIQISEADLSGFLLEGNSRATRNHAVFMRKILKFQQSQLATDDYIPKYRKHEEMAKEFLDLLAEKNLTLKDSAKAISISQNMLNQKLQTWEKLDLETAKKIDQYSLNLGNQTRFSQNLFGSFLNKKNKSHKINLPSYSKHDLPDNIKNFVQNVENYLKGSRTNYDGCDTGQFVRHTTADSLINNLYSFYKFCVFEIPWFLEQHRHEFGSDFKAIEVKPIKFGEIDFRLIFEEDLMTLFCRYFKPFKIFYQAGDLQKFKNGSNTATSLIAVQTLRTLFNKDGYLKLACKSKTIQNELALTKSDLKSWEKKCKSMWSHMGLIDSTCRKQKIVVRPRNPNTTKDNEELAILERVLKLDNPLSAIANLNNQINMLIRDLSPDSETTKNLKEILFISKFLTLLPLRADNLCSMQICDDSSKLQSDSKKVHIIMKNSASNSKIFISAPELKNGKALGPINRGLPQAMHNLISEFIDVRDGAKPMLSLKPAQINEYLNSLSKSLAPDLFPKGLTIHCFRHIVASTVIKNNAAGYGVAAQLLHDTMSQIEKTYGFKRQDQHVYIYYDSTSLQVILS